MTATTIIIDPVTRVEGHLKIETRIENGIVTDARTAGMLFRGIEKALIGYDARVAQQVTQRVCGICPYAHAQAAALALEDAMELKLNRNGQLLRNLIVGAYQIHDCILHFYVLSALDFVDILTVLNYQGSDPTLVHVRNWAQAERQSSRIFPATPFLPRYQADLVRDTLDSTLLVRNYFASFPVMVTLQKMVALFGGKSPHPVAIEAGGVTTMPHAGNIAQYRTMLNQVEQFVLGSYRDDILSVCRAFPHYFQEGRGYDNFLSFPYFPDADGEQHFFAGGATIAGKYSALDLGAISEDHSHSFFQNAGTEPLSPTLLTPLSAADYHREEQSPKGKYSWSSAPRYRGTVMETGPVARLLNSYRQGNNPVLQRMMETTNRELGVSLDDYNSVMGRHLSRYLSVALIIGRLKEQLEQVEEEVLGFVEADVPRNARGVGITEASRGALGHWIETDAAGLIKNYDMIVPSTWNLGPRDATGQPGAVEKMLIGTRIADPEHPIELARIVRSADPCIACSVH